MSSRAELDAEFRLRGTDKAKRQMNDLKSSLVRDAKSIALGFVGTTAAIGAMIKGTQDAIQASLEHERAITRVKVAGFQGVQALDRWAESLQRATGTSSDTILELAALAKAFGASDEMAKRMTKSALDLEAKGLMSAESGVRNLGKSLSGMAGELRESLAGVQDLSKEALQLGGAIDLAEKNAGGAAEAQGATKSGRMAAVTQSFADFQQAVGDLTFAITGQAAGGVTGNTSGGLIGALDGMSEAINSVGTALDKLKPFERIIGMIIGGPREAWNTVAGSASRFAGYLNGMNPVIQSDPTYGIQGIPPQSMYGVAGLPTVIPDPRVLYPGRFDAARELGFLGRYGLGGEIGGGIRGSIGGGMPGAGNAFDQVRMNANDWIVDYNEKMRTAQAVTADLTNTLLTGMIQAASGAREFSDVLRQMFDQVLGRLVGYASNSIAESLFPFLKFGSNSTDPQLNQDERRRMETRRNLELRGY